MLDATQQDVSCGGGVGWGGYDDVHLHLHTCLMLRNRMFHVGVGWGGYDDIHLHLHACLMLRNRTYKSFWKDQPKVCAYSAFGPQAAQ